MIRIAIGRLVPVRLGPSSLINVRRASNFITPLGEYDRLIKIGKLKDDPYQRGIIESLSELHAALVRYTPPKIKTPNALDQVGWRNNKLFKRFFGAKQVMSTEGIPKGIYLYGDVGCGKTMLMDLFYSTVPEHLSKNRLHFHQFMQYVHKRSHEVIKELNLDAIGEEKHKDIDSIPFIAAEISKKSQVLCFDEFQVTDVADAMMLRRLLTALLSKDHGVVLFATSNRKPDDLYINGIQRESFVPCIEILKQRTEVINLNSPTDYRKISRPMSSVYYFPQGGMKYNSPECQAARTHHVQQWYDFFSQSDNERQASAGITAHETCRNYKLKVWGRELNVPKCTPPRVAQFTFKELCGQPLAAGDYLVLASSFKAFIITDIPYLSIYVRDEVRRLITFLDAVYDSGGKLATTGATDFTSLFVEPEEILNDYELKPKPSNDCKGARNTTENDDLVVKHGFSREIAKKAQIFALDEERFAFARALSRLSHMSTKDWVEK